MNDIIDIAVIGMGPAGMSAALTAKARNKNVKIFGNNIESSNLYKAEEVNNYLGLPKISGKDLLESFRKHIDDCQIEVEEKKVVEVFNMGTSFTLNVNNEFVSAKKVIIATGIPKSKGFNNEENFLGKGVSYCATCDGMLYKGKDIAVFLEDEKDEAEVKFLASVCNKVYLIHKYKEVINKELLSLENVVVCNSNKIIDIQGEMRVSKVVLENEELDVCGFFILRRVTLLTNLVKGLEFENNHIKVNEKFETNISGLYAVGDVIGKPYQVSKATGDGQICVLNIIEELDSVK